MKEARILKSFQLLLVSLALSGQIKCHDPFECLEIESGVIAIPAIPTSFFQPEEASNSQTFSRVTQDTSYDYQVSSDMITNCQGSTASVHYCYFTNEPNSKSKGLVFHFRTSGKMYNVKRNPSRDNCNTEVCCSYTELSGFSSPSSFAIQTSAGSLEFKQHYTASRSVGESPLECGGLLLVQIRIETSSANNIPAANYGNVDYCATTPLIPASPSTTVTPASTTSATSASVEDVPGVMTTTSLLSSGITSVSVEDVPGVMMTTSTTSASVEDVPGVMTTTPLLSSGITSVASVEDVPGVMTTTSTTSASVEDVARVIPESSSEMFNINPALTSSILPKISSDIYYSVAMTYSKLASISSETIDETRYSLSGLDSVTLRGTGTATMTSSTSSWPDLSPKTSSDLMSSVVPDAPGVHSIPPLNTLHATDSSFDEQGQNGVNTSALIGGILGCMLLLLLIAMAGLMALLYRRQRMPNQRTSSDLTGKKILNLQTLRNPDNCLRKFEGSIKPGCTSSDAEKPSQMDPNYTYISSSRYEHDTEPKPRYAYISRSYNLNARRPTTSLNDYDDIVTQPPVRASNSSAPLEVDTSVFYDSIQASLPRNASLQKNMSKTSGVYMQPAQSEKDLYRQFSTIKMKYLEHDSLHLGNMIGSGNFGEVYRGVWLTNSGEIEVAVKTLKKMAAKADRIKFLQEAAIMGQFMHPNVVQMYGVALNREPILLVLEFLPRGDLLDQLKLMRSKKMSQVEGDLLNYGCQVACGMKYLSQMGFVHRDLAARNVLVSKENICKIADFGMSRILMDNDYYKSQGGVVPVKWTAPEALHYKKYSVPSDVWSFGIVLYEIWSLGTKPYSNVANSKVLQMIDSGFRMVSPSDCPAAVYQIMIDCWHPTPGHRPSFVQLHKQLLRTLPIVGNTANSNYQFETMPMMRDVL